MKNAKENEPAVDAEIKTYEDALNIALAGLFIVFDQQALTDYINGMFQLQIGNDVMKIYSENFGFKTKKHYSYIGRKWDSSATDDLINLMVVVTDDLLKSVKRRFEEETVVVRHPDHPTDASKNVNAQAVDEVIEWPKVLNIQVQRKESATSVNYSSMPFKFVLDLSELNKDKKDLKYYLYSMSIHQGGASGGHYTAVVRKNLDFFEEDEKKVDWMYYNDSSVTDFSDEQIRDLAFKHATAFWLIREDMIPIMFGIPVPKKPTPDPNPNLSDGANEDIGMIIGFAVGAFAVAGLITIVCVICIRKRKKRAVDSETTALPMADYKP